MLCPNPKEVTDFFCKSIEDLKNEDKKVFIKRSKLIQLVLESYIKCGYFWNTSCELNFKISCDIHDKRKQFTVLLGGTSGSGKSTSSSLLSNRLGIRSVVSTDTIRQVLRSVVSKEKSPILWSSTYNAFEVIPEYYQSNLKFKEYESFMELNEKEKILKGYELQSEMLFDNLEALITKYENQKESLIIEGVHLSISNIHRLMVKHSPCFPFILYVKNEEIHKERFASRAEGSMDPLINKYVKYFSNIRLIDNFLVSSADNFQISTIDNSNIEETIQFIHSKIVYSLFQHST